MKTGLRWKPFNSLGTKGGAWNSTLDPCPCCGYWAKAEFKKGVFIGIKHATFEQDRSCPYVEQQNANPMNRFQRVVFNYADLEDRMYAAKEAVRRDELREARMDGRPSLSGDDSSNLEDVL